MGLDWAPIEFQTFFSHVLVVTPYHYHIYLLTQACLSFSHTSKPLGDALIVLDMGLKAVKSCVSIFLQNLWSLLLVDIISFYTSRPRLMVRALLGWKSNLIYRFQIGTRGELLCWWPPEIY